MEIPMTRKRKMVKLPQGQVKRVLMILNPNHVHLKLARLGRKSVHDQIESLTSAVVTMQNMMMQKGFFGQNETGEKGNIDESSKSNKESSLDCDVPMQTDGTGSETTIYRNAVSKVNDTEVEIDPEISFKLKRLSYSTSSEEQGDTSDDLVETDFVDNMIVEAQRRKSLQLSHNRTGRCNPDRN